MSEEQKQNQQPIQPPKNSKWKAMLGKKWTFPVIYMGAAALILAFIMWFQDSRDYNMDPNLMQPGIDLSEEPAERPDAQTVDATATNDQEAKPVTQTEQKALSWPVAEETEVVIVMDFYNDEATEDVKAAAMIQYEDTFYPHSGVDMAKKDGTAFEVISALDGKVIRAEKDPMTGYTVEIEHENGLQTVYQSLEDLKVKVGDEVKKGDGLGQSGRNLFEKELGIHLHFEVKEEGQSVSPDKYLSQADTEKQAQ
ncbi:hypothetical protein BEP19_12770 [Ammoniphilus oxalaticus]|uniref:M23ase beta-sheet core domain-containing protein n=1 Tax=Ammoniphilus oxalaticus TaxID=66863 RepID=A0A419SH24_9BACL|nr:M23 family metallopeptidase [Ammoniphilus oxalaticus]RKD23092.1 hypothetical protein BEP19_12770 [Ammoniphilus oxalaticus]